MHRMCKCKHSNVRSYVHTYVWWMDVFMCGLCIAYICY